MSTPENQTSRYLLPENSGRVSYHRKGEVTRALKNTLATVGMGAVALMGMISGMATVIVMNGEPIRIPFGEKAALMDFSVDRFTYPASQSLDIMEGYCAQSHQPRQFLFQFTTDGSPSTDVNILEICSK